MCNCNYDWEEIASIVKQFPNLEALNLSGNKIESVEKCKLPESLTFIDLSNNPINSFCQLATAFGDLNALDELNLMSCNITEIRPFGAKFPALRTLVLTGNPIQSIESFDPLNSIKSLEFLSVRDCTVYKNDDETIKQEIIARIGSLRYLNRSAIPLTDAENTVNSFISRRGAEIDFLNRRAEAWEAVTDHEAWNLKYPRWSELLAIHGDPVKVVKIDTTLNAKSIKVRLSAADSKEPIEKELLRSTQIKMVYLIFKKLFKLKLKPGQLCYGAGKHKLEKMDWSLDDYAIDSGDTICPV